LADSLILTWLRCVFHTLQNTKKWGGHSDSSLNRHKSVSLALSKRHNRSPHPPSHLTGGVVDTRVTLSSQGGVRAKHQAAPVCWREATHNLLESGALPLSQQPTCHTYACTHASLEHSQHERARRVTGAMQQPPPPPTSSQTHRRTDKSHHKQTQQTQKEPHVWTTHSPPATRYGVQRMWGCLKEALSSCSSSPAGGARHMLVGVRACVALATSLNGRAYMCVWGGVHNAHTGPPCVVSQTCLRCSDSTAAAAATAVPGARPHTTHTAFFCLAHTQQHPTPEPCTKKSYSTGATFLQPATATQPQKEPRQKAVGVAHDNTRQHDPNMPLCSSTNHATPHTNMLPQGARSVAATPTATPEPHYSPHHQRSHSQHMLIKRRHQ
jgi:hypothetical protein